MWIAVGVVTLLIMGFVIIAAAKVSSMCHRDEETYLDREL